MNSSIIQSQEHLTENFPRFDSSSSYKIQDEHDGALQIHALKERPTFHFQVEDVEEKYQFSGRKHNLPIQQKESTETVQEFMFTEEMLEFANQALKQIPKVKQSFINVRLLNLSQNQLSHVPMQIMKMVNLKKLVLNQNYIITLPQFLQNLKYLDVLELAENQLSVFNINPPRLRVLNLASNLLEQLYLPNVEHLSIQMNRFTYIPKGFNKVLYGMQQLELDWFKYCRPALPMKLHFDKYPKVKEQLIKLTHSTNVDFETFIKELSINQINLNSTDYKDRNYFFLAGMNDEVGVIRCLHQLIPDVTNAIDFDQNTAMSACYLENKLRSVTELANLGGRFAPQTILQICQRVDHVFLNQIIAKNQMIPLETLVMFRNMDGNTPLHMLMINFNKNAFSQKMADKLLESGADPNAQNYEGWSCLDVAVKRGQIQALQFAYTYNLLKEGTIGIPLFDFQRLTGPYDWNLVHLAASTGNLEMLERLCQYNLDFFAQSRCNRLPRNLAIQSLTMLKSMRKLERKWIQYNIIEDTLRQQQSEKNVQQMKVQIEKNMNKKHFNMIQKPMEEDDQDQFELEQLANELNSSSIASENSVRETIAESAPIFSRMANKEFGKMQIQTMNIESLNHQDFADQLPEILRLLRNQNVESAIQKLRYAVLSDMLPLSERLKYKNQLLLILIKLKQNSKYELKSYLSHGIQVTLNEYQFKRMSPDQINAYLKLIAQIQKEQYQYEKQKINQLILQIREECSSQSLNMDLLVTDLATIQEYRTKLSNNLIYNIANNAEKLPILYEQSVNWILATGHQAIKFSLRSTHVNLNNYEYLQKLIKPQKRKKALQLNQNYDKIEQDMIEPEQSISSHRQFIPLSTPFQKDQ